MLAVLLLACVGTLAGCGASTEAAPSSADGDAPDGASGSAAPPPMAGAPVVQQDSGVVGPVPAAGAAAPTAGADAPVAPMPDAGPVVPDPAGAPAPEPSVVRDTGLAEAPCLADITGYSEPGPFEFEAMKVASVNVLVPEVPADCHVPVVHFSNGTGATCATYQPVLDHLASHGFLTTCYESPNTGDGSKCAEGLGVVLEAFADRAARRIGSLGQSSGGQGAVYCAVLAREAWGSSALYTVHTMAGESGFGASGGVPWMTRYQQVAFPVLMINGSEDALVSAGWVGQGFDALADDVEAYWYEAVGAPHIPIPARWMNESAVAWLRWQLLGDAQACEHFKVMPDSADWDSKAVQNPTDC